MNDENDLDELLRSSVPPSPVITGAVLTELYALTRATVGGQPPRRRRTRHWLSGLAAAGIVAATVASGTAISSEPAWDTSWGKETSWESWTDHPIATITYRLPGGGQCWQRLTDVQDKDAASVAFVTHLMRTTDLVAGADVPAAMEEIRSHDFMVINPEGKLVHGGYGTWYYNADVEYDQAVTRAVADELDNAAVAAGHSPVSYAAEVRCQGQTW